jgi:cytochrome c biogenesis protein CcmG/thiol:disulfide interchange protein DsbE
MKIKISPFIYTIIFLIIFLVLYKGLQNSNIYTPNLKMEKNIPSFKAKIFENGNFVSEKIFQKDKFYLLNIWASWCVPCREEHSFLTNLNKEEKIEIIGLNYKDDKKMLKFF